MNREELLIAIFVAVESAHAFSAFNPSIFTIHRFRDELTEKDIAKGCVLASLFSLAIGGVCSALIRSPLPLAMALGVAGGMSAVYLAAARGKI